MTAHSRPNSGPSRAQRRLTFVVIIAAVVAFGAAPSTPAAASTFTCSVSPNLGPYCTYSGQVKYTYVNEYNTILLYFDDGTTEAQRSAEMQSVGISVTFSQAAQYSITDNPDFAKLLYKTLVTAQLTKRDILVMLLPRSSNYLTIDRIRLK